MATVITKYINTDTGSDSGDGSAEAPWDEIGTAWDWFRNEYGEDLTTADVQPDVLCSGTAAHPRFAVDIARPLKQDATRFVRFRGDWDGLAWNAGQFRIESSTYLISMYMAANFTKFERIQFRTTSSSTTNQVGFTASGAGALVELADCLIDATDATAGIRAVVPGGNGWALVCRNVVVLLPASGSAGFRTSNGTHTLIALNCTVIGGQRGFYKAENAGTMIAINCGADGQSVAGFETANSWGAGTDYNASEDDTAPGANSEQEVEVTLAGAYQLHESDTAWAGKGTSLAQYTYPLSKDIAGTDHSAPVDIGAWSLATEAAPVTADRLAIVGQPPSSVQPGTPFTMVVAATDNMGAVDSDMDDNVTLTLTATPAGGGTPTLGGTLTKAAVAGFAVFDDLELALVGSGYKITASSDGLTPAESNAFTVAAGAVAPAGGAPTHSGGDTVRPVTQNGTAAQRTIYFEALDSDGAAVTLSGPAQISIDGASPTTSTNNVVATGASGRHKLELSAGECDTLDRNIKVMPGGEASFILGGEAHVVAGAVSAAPLTLATIASAVLDTARGVASLGTMIRRMFNKRDVVVHPSGGGKLQLRVYDDAGTTPIVTEEVTGAVSVTAVNPEP